VPIVGVDAIMITGRIILSFVVVMTKFTAASTKYQSETFSINNTAAVDLVRALPNVKIKRSVDESNVRVLDAYTHHSVQAQSLSQELYGIVNFPEGDTRETFQDIYDDFVESYFTLRVDSKLVLESKITITNVLVPPTSNRNLRKRTRHLEIFKEPGTKRQGSRVVITYDQQLSYFFPKDEGVLPLETLVTLPFITDSGRDDFNLKLRDSGDASLQNIIGVSEVNVSPQNPISEPIPSPTQDPPEPASEPNPSSVSPPINTPTNPPTKFPTPVPSKRPTIAPVQTTLSPSKEPVSPPTFPPTFTPTAKRPQSSTAANSGEKTPKSGGISGLLIIGCLMAVLFLAFTINMQYCMGEYVD